MHGRHDNRLEDRYHTAVRELIEAKVQNSPKTAKPLTPPSRCAGLDIVAILQESIRGSAEKRKKTPARNTGRRTSTPSLKTKRRAASLGNN
jgi:non-homologous end joining protein Ku